ncbi:hypothetical protein [Streptomyces sp. NPDC001787]|uniref:hypothetical protein n=1 Tax=Streptomyces sp. NPDC001787 TaxID=3154523 RepID=UPI003325BCF8
MRDTESRPVPDGPLDGSAITELRILPPLAIGRFGSSGEPMDNYHAVVREPTGYRELRPAPTLHVDPDSGAITEETQPAEVRFRDGAGRIRPVAPFLELWARFGTGDLEPLTTAGLEAVGLTPADLRWRVVVANLKAARRTGDVKDGIHADTGPFNDHAEHPLAGRADNFKAGKSISLGTVRFIRPTGEFPEIRMRFVPSRGAVFGVRPGDPQVSDDVYDPAVGRWDDHFDGDPAAPLVTFPAQTYEGTLDQQGQRYISKGYVDDACDGIVGVEVTVGGRVLGASARICSGVPDFAPDSFHVRTLQDDLLQALFGPTVSGELDRDEVEDTLRRALETVRLMNTMAMNADQGIGGVATNATNQARHETAEYERAFEPVFGQGEAPYHQVLAIHEQLMTSWRNGVLPIPRDLIRSYDEAGDFSTMARQKMPALMRGSDTLELALTRRQIELLRRAALETQATTEPERMMLLLVEFFRAMAPLHEHIPTESGPLSDLFVHPLDLLEHVRTANAQGPLAGAEAGQRLVTPGDAEASAFVRLLRREDHPMHGPFSRTVPGTDKTGLEIVEAWIAAMPPDGDE